MQNTLGRAFFHNFLGSSPSWYKLTILAFLIINPIIYAVNPFVAGWLLIVEFIFTLALALKCYPLPSGGLLAIEAVILGMTSPATVYQEVAMNLPVILLLMFMVAGIHFMKEGLLFMFTKILLSIRSKILLSMVFCFMGAFLSAFLDALTVTAVIISVAYGFYQVFHAYSSNSPYDESDEDLEQFRGFLRNLMMHGAVGTALGGATTIVGEPQNLLIGTIMEWNFADFFHYCSTVSIPVAISGLILCGLLEITKIAGYGYQLPDKVRSILEENAKSIEMTKPKIIRLIIQAIVGVILIMSLALHLAEVGMIGLMIIILLTAFNGVTDEHHFGEAFADGLPFTALLIVFFSVVAVIHDQHLFTPIINFVLAIEGQNQLIAFFLANGILSMISDNVFVATVYITEVQKAFAEGMFNQDWYNKLAVSVNMGTNIPSVATPNGQAAFLFLLTSSLAPLIRLSYLEMVKLALPYTIVLTGVGLLATTFLL
ncbi:MAG: sodium/proton antiporter NhaB [Deferribacteraceae bacterium]|nr:sodium/proton antiporter NhaB [Deferribacteraceae bacterium]